MMQYAEQGTGSRSGSSNSRTGVKQRAFGLREVCLAIPSAKVTHECLNVLGQRLHGAAAGERQLSESSLASTWLSSLLGVISEDSRSESLGALFLHMIPRRQDSEAADASGVSLDDLLKPAIEAEHELRHLFATDKSHGRLVDAHVGLVDVFDAPDAIRVTRALVQVVQDDQDCHCVVPLTEEKRRLDGPLAKYAARGFEVHYPANLRREDVYPSIYERPLMRIDDLGRLLVLGKLSIRADPQSILWGKPNPLRRYNIMDASGMLGCPQDQQPCASNRPQYELHAQSRSTRTNKAQDENDQHYIRGRISFIPTNHGRKSSPGNLKSMDEAEWISQAYISPTEKLFTAIAACDREAVLNLLVDIDLNCWDCVDRTPLHTTILSAPPILPVIWCTREQESLRRRRTEGHLYIWRPARPARGGPFNIFHYMCDKNHIELLQRLLHNKLPPDVVEAQQSKNLLQTPLHIAVQKGHTDAVRALLEFSADSLHLRDAGCPALHAAVLGGFPVTIVRLIDAAPEGLGLENGAGHTPLEMAVLRDLITRTETPPGRYKHPRGGREVVEPPYRPGSGVVDSPKLRETLVRLVHEGTLRADSELGTQLFAVADKLNATHADQRGESDATVPGDAPQAWDAFYADCCDAKDPSRTLVIVRAGLAHYGPIARQLVHRVEVQASVEARLAHANSEPGNIRGGAYLQALQGSLVYRKMHMFATTACRTKVDFRKDLGPCLKGHRKVRCKLEISRYLERENQVAKKLRSYECVMGSMGEHLQLQAPKKETKQRPLSKPREAVQKRNRQN
ncbi:hypothetical protein K438DRAFT_1789151 [Mycena galopus ATCC 62051]|nr:hypothetical protein K438DRAFT_1789151 [Mycena galopus ATCC 62051]